WWLYAMVFSTILPTALHGGLCLLGIHGLMPLALRRRVAAWLRAAPASAPKAAIAPLAVATIWALPLAGFAMICAGLWWFAADAARGFGLWYLGLLTDLAVWVGAF
ncbi:MAG: hypothetical protein GY717_16960, partial [Rhodobacteraceae bacterium]|nr:hypothetical protein [Paracoccaceae bacterium]